MKRSLPINLSVVALLVVLWQTEASAETTRKQGGRTRRGRAATRPRAPARLRPRAGTTRVRELSRMRERARLYEPYIAAAAREYGVDPRALWTIAYLETRFRPWLVSPKGARGLMQFIPSTAARYGLNDPDNPRESIYAAARYVRDLSHQFGGRLELVLASYNSGEGAVDAYLRGRTVRTRDRKIINPRGLKTGGVPPYSETRRYVSRGLLVYSRLTSAGVFSPELIAGTRALTTPQVEASQTLIQSVNGELAGLGGVPALTAEQVSTSTRDGRPRAARSINPGMPRREAAATPARVALNTPEALEEVFFDVHSGVRYLVKEGRIVRPLEALSGADETTPRLAAPQSELARNTQSGTERTRVARSIYLGSRSR